MGLQLVYLLKQQVMGKVYAVGMEETIYLLPIDLRVPDLYENYCYKCMF